MRHPAFILVAAALLAAGAHAQTARPPQREQDYIAIVEKARKQYAAGRSVDARKTARVTLQINVHQFMGLTHAADNWVGVYKTSKRADNSNRSIEIEIAPGVTIATWDSAYADSGSDTMIRPYTPLAKVLDSLTIGEPVIFSANLIGSVISGDDDMILRPRVIASFSKLKKLSDVPGR